MISTKGRYALRVMLELSRHDSEKYIPIKDVAAAQEISQKYIEQIMPLLTRQKLVEGIHGKGGGYRLTRPPENYTVWDILIAAEGDPAPVSCLKADAEPCPRAASCLTLPMWQDYARMIREYFSGITLTDLLNRQPAGDFSI